MRNSSEHSPFNKIPTQIFNNADNAVKNLAIELARKIRERQEDGRHLVLGLATGSTPEGLYCELVRMHREEELSFKNVVSFNLDEYYRISRDHAESYYSFMNRHLFDHIDMPRDQINIPNGDVEADEVPAECLRYEQSIADAGGIDVQILGIGRTGHIGFNEPGSTKNSKTRMVTLDALTIKDAAKNFAGENNVPRSAITMGIGSILNARQIYLLAWGNSKAAVVKAAIEDEVSKDLPASFLQNHDNVRFILDTAAASALECGQDYSMMSASESSEANHEK